MENVLVTGCAGFIGSHLVELLLAEGHSVRGVDSFTDYYNPAIKRDNLKKLQAHAHAHANRFTLVEADLERADLSSLLADVTCVFHLAGEPGVRKSWGKEFTIYLERNIFVTQRLLEALRGRKISKLVFASSSSVYGDRVTGPCQETNLCRPYSPYGVSKLAAENLCLLYHDNYGVPAVALRYFTVFGPRQRPDMAFHRFFRAIRRSEPLTVFGDGNQSRDFTYVADAVAGTYHAALSGKPGEVYNIGGGCPATLGEVLDHIRKVVEPKPVQIVSGEVIPGDVRHTRADIAKARRDFNYQPRVGLLEGLKNEWQWSQGLQDL